MEDRFCITLLEAAEMNGFASGDLLALAERHDGIAIRANGSWRIDPEALKDALTTTEAYLQAA